MKSNQVLIPNIEQVADFGTSEPFVARISIGLSELLNGLNIGEAEKIQANDQILEIFQELSHAFISLRDINDIESGKKALLLANQKKAYQDFYGYCWTSYKDRMPKLMQILGIDVGFIFGNEKTFNVGSEKFKKIYPEIGEEFIRMVSNDRTIWQNTVRKIRNDYIEHKKGNLSDDAMKTYFNQKAAQLSFENCWQAIEDITVICMSTKLFNGIKIGLIPDKEIDKSFPKKFCFYMTKNEK